ncbi:MAG: hypothetical protein DME81_06330 [Verrucomicrobia bacterium]|nr:MAG: hypothetical protein DME81_06330 [Verrucomicrobiota bacterium]
MRFLHFDLRQTPIPIGRRLENAYLQTMKILFRRYLVACVLFGTTTFAFAGEFKSRIITSSPLMITVPDNHFLKVSNFTQEGGVDRGVVTVTLTGQTEQTGQTANVLTASRIDSSTGGGSQNPPEIINRMIIAGPAQVTVAPVLGATLFITYRKLPEEGTSTTTVVVAPTPTPTVTATPTVTPTPTPTATPTPTL